ncbi:MAG: hypothetical protein CVU31_03975 [Betaproteobacteria bacterium HGW-Betaproteobacteria-4]|jgi:TPR repeat protein|nr:MAG: hypothetical protein CVU31_03975 [Betaproteobacteria bacterium HGW-Betaproteobacteria-4]
MLNLIKSLVGLNAAMSKKIRSVQACEEGLAFSNANEFKKAFPLLLEASELGNEKAMSVLGSMYLLGQGTPENGVEAVRWLENSIKMGFDDAISVLGMAYVTGKAGVKIDIEKGREMLIHAAESGDEQSARMLGMMDRREGMFRHLKKKR